MVPLLTLYMVPPCAPLVVPLETIPKSLILVWLQLISTDNIQGGLKHNFLRELHFTISKISWPLVSLPALLFSFPVALPLSLYQMLPYLQFDGSQSTRPNTSFELSLICCKCQSATGELHTLTVGIPVPCIIVTCN